MRAAWQSIMRGKVVAKMFFVEMGKKHFFVNFYFEISELEVPGT